MPILEKHYDHNGDFSVAGIPFTTMRERMPQLLAGISDGSTRIKKIVLDLKRFAQPDASTPLEPVDVNSVVKSSLTLLSNLLKKSTNHFRVEYGENIPKINGNYQHLEQVVINLVQNACQALPDKNKAICISTSYQEKRGTIRIKVEDQGVGIPAESLARITDPFFTTRRGSGGTGLGLSVSSSIIEEHAGELSIHSEEGKGTTFTVILPSDGKKDRIKVLVVDDDKIAREMIVAVFEEDAAFSVEEASDGMDACFKLGMFRPDLLILDIQMPDMNGVEVCKRIKATPDYSRMKVLVVTGFIDSEDAGQIAEMGFTHFCTKPVSLKDFQAMVQEVLDSN
ncbi:MAG: response regulator [Deltaproteobacteria bacterium]|nr:response regulator [Deltaproteobacteria bacterium]